MITATDLKNGTSFILDGNPHRVLKYTHQKIGRGGANVKLTLRNLQTGSLVEKTFSPHHKFDEISTAKRSLQFLYRDDNHAVFIDPQSYEQVEIPHAVVGDDINYIKEGQDIDILFWGDKPLSVEIPSKVKLRVTETTPGVKGNSATNIFKSAKLENGLEVKVPLFVKKNDYLHIDTRTGEYLERVS